MQNFRHLTSNEIQALESNGCVAEEWQQVEVTQDFIPSAFRFVEFKGVVKIGRFTPDASGVCFAALENVEICGDVRIRNIGTTITNCVIRENTVIENVAGITFGDGARAGMGEKARVIVESGGREVTLLPALTAQTGYLDAFATSEKFQQNYNEIIAKKIEESNSSVCVIGENAVVRNCGMIVDSMIGDNAILAGVAEISNSTVGGSVGTGSILRNTIVSTNGTVGCSCILENCFIANGAVVDQGFSAENSLFFSNSECLRGEGCSVFAGAYTSSHHKSTLLLAAVYSFYTAGSGSNFSNHRFKLGPVHQGIIERGSKNGSSSYLIWPSHTAPFTTIIGKHLKKIDSSLFPFSLLLEQKGKSVLLPGALLFSAGFERDCAKWLTRDKRDSAAGDLIVPYALNPYTVGKILGAIAVLKELKKNEHNIELDGFEIPVDYISKALARYHAGVNYYYGGVVARALRKHYSGNFRMVDHVVTKECRGEWGDYAGLIAPVELLEKLIARVEKNELTDYDQLVASLKDMYKNYESYQWEWVLGEFGDLNLSSEKELLRTIMYNWVEAAELRLRLVQKDAAKEYRKDLRTGYGMIGEVDDDFEAVRGSIEENGFVRDIAEETRGIIAEAEVLIKGIDHKTGSQ